jgi:hypothetical protein
MDHCHGAFGEIGEMFADQRRVGNQIRARGLALEALGWSGMIGRIFVFYAVVTYCSRAQTGGFFGYLLESLNAVRIRRGKEVAPPVEMEPVAAFRAISSGCRCCGSSTGP